MHFLKKLELQRLEIQLSEKKIKEAEGALVGKKETKEAAAERLAGKKSALEEKKVELEKIISKTEKRRRET